MTSYTQADLDAVERAIVALSTDPNSRPQRVRYASGMEIEYTAVTLPQLRAVRDEIASALSRASSGGRRMSSVARFRPGF